MDKQARRLILVAALLVAGLVQAQADTAGATLPTVEQAKAQYLGRWTLIAGNFGSWDHEFTDVRQGVDGKLELDMLDYYEPRNPVRRVAELSSAGLTFFYDRQACKGMANVDDQGRYLMNFKPGNAAGTKLNALMIGRSCTNSAEVQLSKR